MTKSSLILPIGVVLVCGFLYYLSLPKYQKLQLRAHAAKDLRVNEKIQPGDFYTSLFIVCSRDYVYSSPQGMFANRDVPAYSILDNNNTGFQAQSYIISTPVRIPVKLAKHSAQVVRLGDEIALAINGKVFPERNPLTKYFIVLDIIPDNEKEFATLLIEASREHISDSLWLKNADDHIVPIIVNRLEIPVCPKGLSAVWIKDPVSLRGKYECKAVRKITTRVRKPPC